MRSLFYRASNTNFQILFFLTGERGTFELFQYSKRFMFTTCLRIPTRPIAIFLIHKNFSWCRRAQSRGQTCVYIIKLTSHIRNIFAQSSCRLITIFRPSGCAGPSFFSRVFFFQIHFTTGNVTKWPIYHPTVFWEQPIYYKHKMCSSLSLDWTL